MKAGPTARLLAALPAGGRELLGPLLERAETLGLAVHLVGGPVRDYLLELPVRDVDLVVEPRERWGAPELAREAVREGTRVVAHDRFGTARLEGPQGAVDLATARRETYDHPGALPSVAFASLEEDLRRRDFTVNALAIPLTKPAMRGRPAVIETEGGLADLEARQMRIFHPGSFHDDPTRALRAARLGIRLGFTPTRGTRAALRAALRDGAFGRVKGERLRRELFKLFEDAELGLDPARALRWLDDWHVLAVLEPGLGFPKAAGAPLRRLGRSLQQPPWTWRSLRSWVPGFALWLAPLEPPLRNRTLRRFALRGETSRRIAAFPRALDRSLRALGRARGRGEVDRLLGELDDEMILALHASAAPPLRRRVVRYAVEDRSRRSPVSGADLVALGLEGPEVGRGLARVRAAHLDGIVRTRAEALALAEEIARRRTRRSTTRRRTSHRRG